MATVKSISEFEEAVAKLGSALGLHVESSTWKHTLAGDDGKLEVTVKLTGTDQLSLFGPE